MTHLQISGLDLNSTAGLFPYPVPDLYVGEPLSVVLKADRLPDHLTVTGMIGPMPWQSKLSLHDAAPRNGISVHWAQQKITSLTESRNVGRDADSVRQAIIDVALGHHLVSRYTSLVAMDITPARPQNHPLQSHPMKTNLPAGQQYEAIFGLPQTATNGPRHLLAGIASLTVGWLLWILSRRIA